MLHCFNTSFAQGSCRLNEKRVSWRHGFPSCKPTQQESWRPGKLMRCPSLKSKGPEAPLGVLQLCAEDFGAWNGLNAHRHGWWWGDEMLVHAGLHHQKNASFAGPLGSPASAWPLPAPKASLSVRNAPADTAQMLKQSLSGMEAVWTSESGTRGTLSLLSQFQALAPNWRPMNGLKNKLHFPGAEGVADPLLPLRFPSSCLSRLLGEAGCPIPLGAGYSRVSFSRSAPS